MNMGGVVDAIFGGGKSSPSVVTYEAEQAPRESEQEAVASGVRDEERRKLRQRRLMGGTMLSSPSDSLEASQAQDQACLEG